MFREVPLGFSTCKCYGLDVVNAFCPPDEGDLDKDDPLIPELLVDEEAPVVEVSRLLGNNEKDDVVVSMVVKGVTVASDVLIEAPSI